MQEGPIIFIDDDPDDQEIYRVAVDALCIKRPLLVFDRCADVLEYLRSTTDEPFIIFADFNLPQMSGLELKRAIEEDPHLRCMGIPFVLVSTTATPDAVNEAGELGVQGFFVKPITVGETATLLKTILDYWSLSRHRNNVLH